MKTTKAIAALSALAQESRLAIFRLLVKHGEEGLPAGTIAEQLQIPAATLSFHLSQLSNAGLINASRAGRMIYYSASYKKIKRLTAYLMEDIPKKTADKLEKLVLTEDGE
jgi:ArsR family transcriptional regulator, arsenate/arsenite/antimonite-responsive transcriptional repressor